jgi:nucleotide-binding universal stress UspA family protein
MRIEKVVVGIDFSRPGIEAAQWVVQQLSPDTELILAHVVDLPRTPNFLRGVATSDAELEALARSDAEPRLRELAAFLRPARVRTVIRTGRAHEELAKLAAEIGADLVAVGPHGDRPRPWKMLGTTAERLSRAAAPAVLIVVNARSVRPRRLLVALDDTPIATTVLDWTKTIADTLGARVTAVHVLQEAAVSHLLSVATSTPGGETPRPSRLSPETVGEANRWLATLVDGWLAHDRTESIVAHGNPGDVILETARDVGAELIILGRRGRRTLIPAVAGSTVSTVLHGSPVPVLVVTEDAEDWIVPEEG